jgi:GNAT superfamily N-acetyltransferase
MPEKIDFSKTGGVYQAHQGKKLVGSLTVDPPEATTEYASDYGQEMGDKPPAGSMFRPDWAEREGHPQAGQGVMFDHQQTPPIIDVAVVHPRYQRRGIASTLHNLASAQFGQHVEHSDNITPEAHAWATGSGHGTPTAGPTSGSWGREDSVPGDFAWGSRQPKVPLGSSRPKDKDERDYVAHQKEKNAPVQASLF